MEAVVGGKRYKTEVSTLVATLVVLGYEDWQLANQIDFKDLKEYSRYGEEFIPMLEQMGLGEHDLYMTPNGRFFWVMDESRDDVNRIVPLRNPEEGREWFDFICHRPYWGRTYVPWEDVNPGCSIEDA